MVFTHEPVTGKFFPGSINCTENIRGCIKLKLLAFVVTWTNSKRLEYRSNPEFDTHQNIFRNRLGVVTQPTFITRRF